MLTLFCDMFRTVSEASFEHADKSQQKRNFTQLTGPGDLCLLLVCSKLEEEGDDKKQGNEQ